MNVFVLSTGRCGSTTFAAACQSMTNFTAAHESERRRDRGRVRERYRTLRYPDQHIEGDNRLAWFLGALDEQYGKDAFYVHLLRDREEVAASFLHRWTQRETNIIFTFAWGILTHPYDRVEQLTEQCRLDIARHYWDTVNANIRFFLRDKPSKMTMHLERIKPDFEIFWHQIGATGNLAKALATWDTRHNASPPTQDGRIVGPSATTGTNARRQRVSRRTGTEPVASPPIHMTEQGLGRALAASGSIDLTAIEPPVHVGKWTLSAEALRLLVSLVEELNPRHVLEFGSGLSTRVLAPGLARAKVGCFASRQSIMIRDSSRRLAPRWRGERM